MLPNWQILPMWPNTTKSVGNVAKLIKSNYLDQNFLNLVKTDKYYQFESKCIGSVAKLTNSTNSVQNVLAILPKWQIWPNWFEKF